MEAEKHQERTVVPESAKDIIVPRPEELSTATTPTVSYEHTTSDSSSDTFVSEPDLENGLQNLPALQQTNTGPAYSVFSPRQKAYIVAMVTFAAFISPTSANIYFPALNSLASELHVSNTLINLTLTSYMIFQGLAPTIFGDLADMAGRRPAYIVAFVVYLGANIGLALQDSYAALFLLRCLQSTGSSGAIALGYGVVADLSTSAERGKYMGIVGAGTMMGPALSPVIGGILTQFLGWRSIFWFLVIISALFLIPYTLSVPETGRNVVGNGSVPPQPWNMTVFEYLRFRKTLSSDASDPLSRTRTAESRRKAQDELAKHRKLRFPNPLKTIHIILEKDIALILLYNALIYCAFYDIMASLPSIFLELYSFNNLQIGLCYLPFGAGCALASYLNGLLLDWNYRRVAKQVGFHIDRKHGDDLRNFPIEHARIDLIWPMLFVGLTCYIGYAWAVQFAAPLAVPLVLTFFIGLCINGAFNVLSILLVDLYPGSPATATAANNLVRCFFGAAATGVVDIMIAGMGRGWCFTFIALVCVAAMPLLWAELRWGRGWREERRVRMEMEAEGRKKEEVEVGVGGEK